MAHPSHLHLNHAPKIASFLKTQGYQMPDDFVLESLDLSAVLEERYVLIVLYG